MMATLPFSGSLPGSKFSGRR